MHQASAPPIRRNPRFWIALPALILLLADTTLTFLFQPASYWTESYANRMERSPLGSAILAAHPALFAVFMLIWALIVILLLARLRGPLNRMLALAVVVGHSAGIYGWLVTRNYGYAIPMFLLVGILTVVCWQRADACRPTGGDGA